MIPRSLMFGRLTTSTGRWPVAILSRGDRVCKSEVIAVLGSSVECGESLQRTVISNSIEELSQRSVAEAP